MSNRVLKRRTVTETLMEECPNCGAARIGDETVCGFCGTSMVNRTAVTEEVLQESGEEYSSDRPIRMENLDGKAVTVIHPIHWNDARTIFLFAIAGLCFLTGIISAYCLSFSSDELADDAMALLGLILVGPMGLFFLCYAIIPVKSYEWFVRMAEEYDATVIKMSKVINQYSMVTVMKASFVKDGETCIVQVKMPSSVSPDRYESGSTVKVKVYGEKILICSEEL